MAETFSLSELVIPGTAIRVRADGLIGAGAISSGNIGIVGTALREQIELDADGNPVLDDDGNPVVVLDGDDNPVFDNIYGQTYSLSDYDAARRDLGPYDALSGAQRSLVRSIEILFRNGARQIYARPLDPRTAVGEPEYTAAFNELLKEDVNILVLPETTTTTATSVLGSLVDAAEGTGKDVIAVIGCDETAAAAIGGQVTAHDRLIFTAPAIRAYDSAARDVVDLPGNFTAVAVAGLISSLTPQTSPTNKVLSGVTELVQRFSYGETRDLIKDGVMVLEKRQGIRVVRGISSEMATNGPFRQVTTRRITDFAKAGIRSASNPFIGRLNNQRVRKALHGAIDGFLTTMVQDEALITYQLEVTATRQDEIAGRAMVNVFMQPTFSIDFVAVTLVLQ